MSKIKNDGLHHYGAEPFERQQFGTSGVERVNERVNGVRLLLSMVTRWRRTSDRAVAGSTPAQAQCATSVSKFFTILSLC